MGPAVLDLVQLSHQGGLSKGDLMSKLGKCLQFAGARNYDKLT